MLSRLQLVRMAPIIAIALLVWRSSGWTGLLSIPLGFVLAMTVELILKRKAQLRRRD